MSDVDHGNVKGEKCSTCTKWLWDTGNCWWGESNWMTKHRERQRRAYVLFQSVQMFFLHSCLTRFHLWTVRRQVMRFRLQLDVSLEGCSKTRMTQTFRNFRHLKAKPSTVLQKKNHELTSFCSSLVPNHVINMIFFQRNLQFESEASALRSDWRQTEKLWAAGNFPLDSLILCISGFDESWFGPDMYGVTDSNSCQNLPSELEM